MTEGSKTYIPKNFYTKTTYITLLSEKFGGLKVREFWLKTCKVRGLRQTADTLNCWSVWQILI
ncbi:hypothetical protein Hanom_Chr07g00667011 [Helianthus anomalus]